jgi:hypothetical protein
MLEVPSPPPALARHTLLALDTPLDLDLDSAGALGLR